MSDRRLSTLSISRQNDDERVRAVRHRIATAILPPLAPEVLGEVRLLPHQRRAAARLQQIIDRHGGALLADVVGLGKTYTALALARQYERAAVLAPAGLVAMWQAALLRTGQRGISVHSLHRASRHAPPAFPEGRDGSSARTLVIVDEAHALRNANTARYRHIARAVSGCDVLLLSATPLHNTPQELQALFALFRGTHADALRPETLSALIVRRERMTEENSGEPCRAAPPPLRVHRARTIPQDPRTLDRLLALPAPLPARDGAVAGALIRLGLLRAWCSSDAALTHAIARRLQRGAAMRDALEAGRHPTQEELRSWLVSDVAGADTQLGFPELLVEQALDARDDARAMTDALDRHCVALRELREHHAATARADRLRVAYLRNIRERHPGIPVVAFSQHSRTIQALFRALSDIAGVGMVTSRQARIATGPIARTELLGYFAPRAHGRPPPPAQLQLSMLLTTDLMAEGVNLQDAGVVVHLDLPWTDALRTQRTGRVVRIGSPHALVHEYRLRGIARVRRVVRLEARVARKALLTVRLVGGATRRSPADIESAWTARLESWAAIEPAMTGERPPATSAIMYATERVHAALALVRLAHGACVLAVVRGRTGRLRVTARTRELLAISAGRCPGRYRRQLAVTGVSAFATMQPIAMSDVRRAVHRWIAHQRVRQASGVLTLRACAPQVEGPGAPLSRTQQHAMSWLRERIASWTAVERQRRGSGLAEARRCIVMARGAGCEEALRKWICQPSSGTAVLDGWRRFPELARAVAVAAAPADGSEAGMHADGSVGARASLEACLLVRPPEQTATAD